ncbi:MAG: hypothetical protein KC800_17760, partial [Candidatus Eremiobacteraeota bacterium]|nr:hypothetical protein [Candidatus Eremiobacteraeota bacterium]
MRNLFQQVLTKSSAGLLIVALASVLAVGCGNSDNFVFTNTAPVATTGNLTFNFVQAQGVITVPIGTTTLEFTFYDGPNQTGNVTLTDSQPYAAQVTVFGVPTNTQSYRIVARNANGAALATTTGAVTVVPGQTTTVDVTGALTVLTQPTNTALNVFVSNNGAGNAGDLDLFDQLFGFVRTFVSGNNQGIALDGIGTGFHNGDTDLNIISRLAERTGSFDNTMDRTITLAGSTTVKGSTVFPQAGVAVLADFGGNALYSVSTQGAQIATTFAATAPWDAVADETNDRLFVALTDGSIGVEDDVTTDFSAPFDRTFTATGLDNAHGIAYDAASDTLIVSDVGDPGVADDGEIYIFG